MTVEELIEELKKFPQNIEVKVAIEGDICEDASITLKPKNRNNEGEECDDYVCLGVWS